MMDNIISKFSACVSIMVLAVLIPYNGYCQIINYGNIKEEKKNIVGVNIGWDYSMSYEFSHSYRISSKNPTYLISSTSFPVGKNIIDDSKSKFGVQTIVFQKNDFCIIGNYAIVMREFRSPLVRIYNFGSDLKFISGYFKENWFIALEFGIEYSHISHFKHSEIYKNNIYDNVKDGWYNHIYSGNKFLGIQTGYSFRKSDITLCLGTINNLKIHSNPLVPYYCKLGYNFNF